MHITSYNYGKNTFSIIISLCDPLCPWPTCPLTKGHAYHSVYIHIYAYIYKHIHIYIYMAQIFSNSIEFSQFGLNFDVGISNLYHNQ